jgi:hypothetical protein
MTSFASELSRRELDEYAAAHRRSDWNAVSAVSLDRAYRIGRDLRAGSWAMAGMGMNGWLQGRMRSTGLSYSRLWGVWNIEGRRGNAVERYLFVYGITRQDAQRLSRRDLNFFEGRPRKLSSSGGSAGLYLYSAVETGWRVELVDLRAGQTVDLGRFSARAINKGWSEYCRRPNHRFEFDSWTKSERALIWPSGQFGT